MWTDDEREDYIFHKLTHLVEKYGEEVSADRFDGIIKKLRSYDLTNQNQVQNGQFLHDNGLRRGGIYFCENFIIRIVLRREKYGGGIGVSCTDGERFLTIDGLAKRWREHKGTTIKPP